MVPDRFASDPKKQESYAQLTREINDARDKGDIERLREITRDTEGTMSKMGLSPLNFSSEQELEGLQKLLQFLETMILTTIASLDTLRKDPSYELHQLNEKRLGFIEQAASDQALELKTEIEELEKEAARLKCEIAELNDGMEPPI